VPLGRGKIVENRRLDIFPQTVVAFQGTEDDERAIRKSAVREG